MKNKKAWLRIVEATIAILIIASVLFIMITREPKKDPIDIHDMQRFILEQISSNDTLRGEILQGQTTAKTDAFINDIKPSHWDFTIRICQVDEVCGMPFYVEKEVYADEILIAANLTHYQPKKLKLFVWAK